MHFDSLTQAKLILTERTWGDNKAGQNEDGRFDFP